jgi:hypothetical protein
MVATSNKKHLNYEMSYLFIYRYCHRLLAWIDKILFNWKLLAKTRVSCIFFTFNVKNKKMKTDVYQHPRIWFTHIHARMIHGCFVMAVTNLTLIKLHCSAWTTSKKILSRWNSYDSSTFTAKKCLLSSWNYTLKSVTRSNRKTSRNS